MYRNPTGKSIDALSEQGFAGPSPDGSGSACCRMACAASGVHTQFA